MRKYILTLVLLLFAAPTWAAITIDANSACSGTADSDSTPDFGPCAHTTGTLVNGAILFLAGIDSDVRSFTSCTYAGVAMARIDRQGEATGGSSIEIWYLANPTAGANNLECVFSSINATGIAGTIVTYSGVKQTGMLTGTDWVAFAAANTSTMNITCAAGNLVIDLILSSSTANFTTTGSNTELREVDNATTNSSSTSTLAGAGTTTMSWSMDASENGLQMGTCINAAVDTRRAVAPIIFQ